MITLIMALIAIEGYSESAKRRGIGSWPFVVVGVVGLLILSRFSVVILGPGPEILVAAGWLATVYLSIFLIGGGGRKATGTWQCPDCRLFNPPSTIVCPCGHPAPGFELPEGSGPRAAGVGTPPKLILGLWPLIDDSASAAWAIRQGVLAAFLVSSMQVLVGGLALLGAEPFQGQTTVFIDAIVFALVGVGLLFRSRTAAVVGLSLWLLSAVLSWAAAAGNSTLLMSLFLAVLFLGGTRGAFCYHRYRRGVPPTSAAPPNRAPEAA